MSEFAKEIIQVNIEQELKSSYLDYAMSVIVGRALPDVRDGLKPVHRRALYAMSELGNDYNKPYKKSARIVGDVIGKYHPHGDTAVYDTIVRMAQPFSLRYMLVDGQGNFGSVDGDSPAAMRYTEIRMSKLAHSLLADLEKETVDFSPNYDESEMIPDVLPTRIPNLLANGSSGIAVGMATNIPPHNLNEIIDGCVAMIDNPDIELLELMQHIPGPDFPTAAILNGRSGIVQAYKTGRGRIVLRARSHIEGEFGQKQAIVVTELPYQVNKARLIEKIAELVKDKRIEGISELRDESDKKGMRMVIELRRGENTDVLLNNLYKQTQMQTVFGINMVALDHGQPKVMNLREVLEAFITHRREVVTRRCLFDLRKARERAHLLEGLGIALSNIDEVVELIKKSKSPAEAKEKLLSRTWQLGEVAEMLERSGADSRPEGLTDEFGITDDGYRLSPEQAQAILDLRLHRLTGLEKEKIINEYKALLEKIAELLAILSDPEKLMQVIKDELEEVKQQFGDERRTEIIDSEEILEDEDLIPEECMVVTVSQEGYVKSQPVDTYQAQHRGGKGKTATKMKEEDYVARMVVASSHDTLLCFSNKGKCYWLKVYKIPQASRTSKGRPIVNLLPFESDETLSAVLPVKEYDEDSFIFMATQKGTVKKVALTEFARPRSNGKIALEIRDGDNLVACALTDGSKDVMLFSDVGKVIRFAETDVRPMGRTAAGVRGIRLKAGQKVMSMIVSDPDQGTVLTATENGYGKRTEVAEFRRAGRGGQGVIAIQVSERNGNVVRASLVEDDHEVFLITDGGTMVRIPVSEVRVMGRNTQGVRLISLTKGEKLVGMRRIDED